VSKLILVVFPFIFSAAFGNSEDLARAANENPFFNGGLNPKYEGQ
jgi:hypothetical protein